MSPNVRIVARVISTCGLAALACLHTAWALGSSWPAKSKAKLAEAVVGQPGALPQRAATAAVAGGFAGSALLASGAFGSGRARRLLLALIGALLTARAVTGGDVALAALQLPPASETFRHLDRRYYRPLAAMIGVSVLYVACRRPAR